MVLFTYSCIACRCLFLWNLFEFSDDLSFQQLGLCLRNRGQTQLCKSGGARAEVELLVRLRATDLRQKKSLLLKNRIQKYGWRRHFILTPLFLTFSDPEQFFFASRTCLLFNVKLLLWKTSLKTPPRFFLREKIGLFNFKSLFLCFWIFSNGQLSECCRSVKIMRIRPNPDQQHLRN